MTCPFNSVCEEGTYEAKCACKPGFISKVIRGELTCQCKKHIKRMVVVTMIIQTLSVEMFPRYYMKFKSSSIGLESANSVLTTT